MSGTERDAAESLAEADRYAAGRLSDAREREFEIRMLESADLAAQVDLTHRLRLGLRRLQAHGELPALLSARRTLPWWGGALAASLLLATVAGWWLRAHGLPLARPVMARSLAELKLGTAAQRGVSAAYVLARTRSRTPSLRISIAPDAAPLLLRLLPDIPSSAGYQVSLTRVAPEGDARTLMLSQVPLDQQGFADIYLNPSRLVTGEYRLTLAPTDGAEGEPFALHVERPR